MQTIAVPRDRSPILPLTSARFPAAVYVVLLHSVLWSKSVSTSTWIERFLRNGYIAVSFFFVLSGYILAYVYLDTKQPFQCKKFWLSRFARVYPLLFASLLFDTPRFFFLKLDLYGHGSWTKALAHTLFIFSSSAALMQAWLGSRLLSINAPSWSLSDEAFFYLLFPFMAHKVWKWSRAKGWLSLVYLWGLAMFLPALVTWLIPAMFVQIETSGLQWTVMLTPAFRIFEFVAGIALCSLQKEFTGRFSPQARSRSGYLALGAGFALFVLVIAEANYIPFLMMFNGFMLPVFALVIFGLVNIRGWLALLLSHKYLVLLGESSYAMYLLHWPLYSYMSHMCPITNLPTWILYWTTLVVISIMALFLLERPARRGILAIAKIRPAIIQEEEQVAPITFG